jgi:TPP-dependent pyruvate/acetoin dehydrogenase alpha subunit
MPRKKKNKSAASTKKHKDKTSNAKSKAVRKRRAKKQEAEVLPVLNAEKLKELYATMVRCRMLAERVQSNHTEITTGNVSGFEATLVGAGAHLLSKDSIAMEHGGFVASLIKGTPLHSILARNRGQQTDGTGKAATSKHNGDVLNMKTVLALAAEMKNKRAVMLMFCTYDPETLAFGSEAMATAAKQKLPLVCLIESSLESPLELPNQTASGPYVGADPAFYPRIPVDGSDVVGVFRVAQEAIRRAREGHGPALIECLTARSNAAEKNTSKPSAQYLAHDPLSFMKQYLRRRDLWSDQWSQLIVEGFNRQLDEATLLKNPADAEPDFDNVYSSDARTPRPAAASAR